MHQFLRNLKRRIYELVNEFVDRVCFSVFIVKLWIRRRKKIIVIRRMDALGDVVCTLPLCLEIRKKHAGRVLVYLTTKYCEDIILLSNSVDYVYSAKSVKFRVVFNLFGIIERVYNPLTRDERGSTANHIHLVDALAECSDVILTEKQPRLYPSPLLRKKTFEKYHIKEKIIPSRFLIAINCGPTWPVREWPQIQWQILVNKIHEAWDAHIIQCGMHVSGNLNVYDELRGTDNFSGQLETKELIALVSSCDLVISIDSGPVHIAGAVGTPIIGLFGAVNPCFRLPPASTSVGLHSTVPCLFCHHRSPITHWKSGCPHNIRCMQELDVDTVFNAVSRQLSSQPPKSLRQRQ
jgi:ADP-heptose:LPS heptosyltransferase